MRYGVLVQGSLVGIAMMIHLAGCGASDPLGRHAISGNVTLDGAPVAQGSISFQPSDGGTTSSGAMISAGKYSAPKEQGLPPGKYRVVISSSSGAGTTTDMPGEAPPTPKELIPREWNLDSKETIEVKAEGPFDFNFDIKSKK